MFIVLQGKANQVQENYLKIKVITMSLWYAHMPRTKN